MSIKLMTQVWEIPLPDSDKLVLLALADNANDAGVCWPSVATIARKCSKSERTIQRSLVALEKAGHLERDDRPGKGTYWTVHPRQDDTPDRMTPPSPCPVRGDTVTPKPSVNRQSSVAKATSPRFALPDWVPSDAWAGFEEMRKRIRKPLTDRARSGIVDKLSLLAKDGYPPGAVLDQSTERAWAGVFEVKGSGNGRNEPTGLGRTALAAIAVFDSVEDGWAASRGSEAAGDDGFAGMRRVTDARRQ